jgi:hypothetical protein
LSSVTAELNYLAPLAERPRTYAYDLPAGEPRTNTAPEPHLLPVHDARAINDIVSLDTAGFSLVRHQSRVQDFYDDEEVKKVHYGETEALLKSFTGAHASSYSTTPYASGLRARRTVARVGRVNLSDACMSIIRPRQDRNVCAI